MSNTTKHLTLAAYPGDLLAGKPRPVLSGGQVIGPFQTSDVVLANGHLSTLLLPVWTANVSQLGIQRSSVLFQEDGSWLQRARLPTRSPIDHYSRHLSDASIFKWVAPLVPPNGTVFPSEDKLGIRIDSTNFSAYNISSLSSSDNAQVLIFGAWTAFWHNVSTLHLTSGTLMFERCCLFSS